MPEIEEVYYCDRCGAEITMAPVVCGQDKYCCELCAAGKSCDCGLILDDERRGDQGLDY